VDEMDGEYSTHGDIINTYRVFSVRPVGERPLGRPSIRRDDNIKMYLKEIGYDDLYRIYLV
jgi:hypothetical protein